MKANLGGLVVVGATLAIGALLTPGPASAASPPARRAATVTVQNDRTVPVDVFLEQGDFDIRLGTVAADREGVLAVPRYLDRDERIRIIVQPRKGLEMESPYVHLPVTGTLPVLVPVSESGWVPQPRELIPNPGPNTTTLTVENQRDQTVDVSVEFGEFDKDLGAVEAQHIRTFDLPKWLAREEGDVQVFIHPQKGFDLSSQYVQLKPHAHLEVKVPRN